MAKELETSYLETCYEIYHKNKKYSLNIEKKNSAFVVLCNQLNITHWTIITGYNPYSVVYSDSENEANNRKLKEILVQKKKTIFKAEGISADGQWKPEKSFFAFNISLQEARNLAIKFKQNAIVYGDHQTLPKLIWTI